MNSTPIKPSTDKVSQVFYPLSLQPSNDAEFPISYADNIWDVVTAGQTLASFLGQPGQYDQHTINEALAQLIHALNELVWQLIGGETTHTDFSDDFNDDFD